MSVSRYEMFIAGIEETHLPEYLEAAQAYAKAAAKLVGIGKAAALTRMKLQENGLRVDCRPMGNPCQIESLIYVYPASST